MQLAGLQPHARAGDWRLHAFYVFGLMCFALSLLQATNLPPAERRQPHRTAAHMIQTNTKRKGPRVKRPWFDAHSHAQRNSSEPPGAGKCGPDGEAVLYSEADRPFWTCVHAGAGHDVISDRIRGRGQWDDCEDQVWLIWSMLSDAAPRQPGAKTAPTPHQQVLVIVDVGANIGACSLRLAHLGHSLVSLEPLAQNFRLLTASIALNNLSASVRAFNAGASDVASDSAAAHSESGNLGNTVVGGKSSHLLYFHKRAILYI